MTLLQHEIDFIADRILGRISVRLGGEIRAIIEKEMKRMIDQAITDLDAATDKIVAQLAIAVTTVQTEAKALADAIAASGASLDPEIEARAKRLSDAADAANAALAALQPPASPSPAPAPAAAPAPDAAKA